MSDTNLVKDSVEIYNEVTNINNSQFSRPNTKWFFT